MKKTIGVALGLILAGLVSGCRPVAEGVGGGTRAVVTGHTGGAFTPRNTDRYAVENTAKFVLLDYEMQRRVTCSGLQERVLEDGRLEVVANVRNRVNKRIVVQINCVFKDIQGFPVEETPFQSLVLTENAQEGVRFVSMNSQAKGYTIRVRKDR